MGYIDINDTTGAGSGDATAANQIIEINVLNSINSKTPALGQEPMSGSVPVVIASDQSTIAVNLTNASGTPVGTSGNPIYVNATESSGRTAVNQYAEIMSVAAGSTTTIVQYTVPSASNFMLERVSVSGGNIALYQVLINDSPIETQRTNFGAQLNSEFNFISSSTQGYILNVGDVVKVTVLHNRPYTANFEGRIQMSKIT